ncbi:putative NADH-flavin reductase [Saonia flava]|uniref:Putative NADH-flavin reductase n=1 Tax=Saonia flava TaxID=523696 RepID=A0A846QYX3_9FLAO|nr:NAD(P)H-binding protein [Saonia flava]NJB71403.1 putative NADH-flavin reductase [Saonia flava]
MKTIHKIAVLGGAGKSGQYLVKMLIKKGISIKLLLRSPEKLQIQNPLIEIIKGNARDFDSIHTLLDGCDALISTLGQSKDEVGTYRDVSENIIKAMHQLNLNRYIMVTGLNVDTPFDAKGPQTLAATNWMKANFREAVLQRQEEYEILSKCNLNWTVVRVPMIIQTDETGAIESNLVDCSSDTINAYDLASFLIAQVYSPVYVKKAPFVATL